MTTSFVDYLGNGDNSVFSFNFSYISQDHIKVYVDGVDMPFNWLNPSTVSLVPAPSSGVLVRIQRETPKQPLVDFNDGEVLGEKALDTAAAQGVFLAEEAADAYTQAIGKDADGHFNARGVRIKNTGDPVEDYDTVNKHWVETYGAGNLNAAKQILDNLGTMTMVMHRLPYGTDGYIDVDKARGIIDFFLSEGPQGVAGPEGPQGQAGPQGAQGVQGVQGIQGEKGDKGERGQEGAQGPMGLQGPRGLQGQPGIQGPQGIQGQKGDPGDKGDKGDPGDTGDKGPTGDQGPMGATPLGLAFGRFYLNDEGELMVEYYGSANDNDFTIDADGFLHVNTI